jgi:CheY-like chemotaxis protein
VSGAVAGRHVELRVTDTGEGIAPEFLPFVFERFRQAEVGTTRPGGGLGLGLAIVRHLVELHGGSVRADSEGPGRGSVFTVSIPAIPTPRPEDARPLLSAPGATTRCRVLIIEDHEDAREMLLAMLGMDGHEAHATPNGRDGIDAALRLRPDVALIDVGLPEVDGYQVARALRANPDAKGLYLVALTGYGQPEDRERAREAGFDEHVVKPLAPDRLSAIIRAAVVHRQATSSLEASR